MILRTATEADLPALRKVMARAITELQAPFLDAAQVVASATMMGLDTQLITDGSYIVAEIDGRIVSGGGWSRRATSYGGDHSPGRDARLLDPDREAARIRAMYTDPIFARQGLGRAVLRACEAKAVGAGFHAAELVATLAGEPLYAAEGYVAIERFDDANGAVPVPLIRMRKPLAGVAGGG